MLRFLRVTLEFIAGFIGVMTVLSLLLIWRLSAAPVTSAFLTPYVMRSVDTLVPGTHTEIAHTLLTWDNIDHSISLHTDDLKIRDKSDAIIAEVPNLDVKLNVFGTILGQFLPTELTIEHPQIRLERAADGIIYFAGMTSTTDETDDIKSVLGRVAGNLAHAYVTRKLEITNAVFDVHDARTGSDWAVSMPAVTLERKHEDLTGRAVVDVTQKDQTSTLNVDYNYDRSRGLHVLTTRFNGLTPAFFAGGHPTTLGLGPASIFDLPLSGEIAASFDSDLNIETGSLQIHGDEGNLNYPSFWDKPRAVKSLDIRANYDHTAPTELNVSSVAADFGGPKLDLSITGKTYAAPAQILDFEMAVKLDNWPLDNYSELWPKPIISGVRDWITTSLSEGNFDHGEAVFKGTLPWNDPENVTITEGRGKISASGARVNYLDGMPPLEGVIADASFDLNQMAVQISGGGIGALKLTPFKILMTDFEKDVQSIDIPLKVSGSIPDVLRLIDAPPLGYTKAIGLAPDDVSGNLQGQVELKFPLLKTLQMKDVDVAVDAKLSDAASSRLMKGIDITQGSLALSLDKSGFMLKGPASLNKVPFQASWRENFHETADQPLVQAALTGSVAGDQWTALGVDVLSSTHGPIAVSLQLNQPDKTRALLSGNLDLIAADIKFDQLNWKKPVGVGATLIFTAEMPEGKNIIVKSINLRGPQITAKGDAVLSAEGAHLLSLNLTPFIVGRTNANLHFTQSIGDKGALRFEADGETLDVSGLKGGKEPADADPRPKEYRIKVGKLFTGSDGFITNAEGFAIRDLEGWSEISLHGQADGEHPLDIALTPQDGTRVLSITCDDFGKALKGMGFTSTVSGGKLSIHGASTAAHPRIIEGKAKVGSFTVKDLPVLALLLSATSPFGFPGLITGAMEFDRLDGEFRWEGDVVQLIEVRAAGTSVGMNIDGKVNMSSGDANLNGTMVPFSTVNMVLNWIPLIGEMLTGGEGGGVLAVAYSVTGPLADAKVNVNPISLLTPGFLRNLFFGGGDDADDTPNADETKSVPDEKPFPSRSNINNK